MSNIDPYRAKAYLHEHNQKYMKSAEDYSTSCRQYGEALNTYQAMLAKRIMVYRAERKTIGVDMARLMALADTDWEEREEFTKVSERLNFLEYLRKGMEQVLESYKTESMTIMAMCRYDREGEQNG